MVLKRLKEFYLQSMPSPNFLPSVGDIVLFSPDTGEPLSPREKKDFLGTGEVVASNDVEVAAVAPEFAFSACCCCCWLTAVELLAAEAAAGLSARFSAVVFAVDGEAGSSWIGLKEAPTARKTEKKTKD